VRPERFELPTYCSGGITAQEINHLAKLAQVCASLYLCGHSKRERIPQQRDTSGHWAQN
jgi:hypothetical protein